MVGFTKLCNTERCFDELRSTHPLERRKDAVINERVYNPHSDFRESHDTSLTKKIHTIKLHTAMKLY